MKSGGGVYDNRLVYSAYNATVRVRVPVCLLFFYS